MGTLGYKCRTVENVMQELRFLQSLGAREIYFSDQTFGANRKRTLDLCREMKRENLGFGWVCFSRADLLDEEVLSAMKTAGCHTVMMGVESGSEAILAQSRKGLTKERISNAFHACRSRNVRTVATVILGLPEETEETVRETIAFLKEIDCDFASINVAVPRMRTPLRQTAIREGLISPDCMIMDQSGLASVIMPSRLLTRERIEALRREAVREFYLRPSYLLRRLAGISSWYEFREQLSEGWALFADHGRPDSANPKGEA
jgi:radical SAM superfamily enzyme YgiQ (UPF0313 family)